MKKYLTLDQLNLVKPKFRKLVETVLKDGEKVPYGVVYLSDKSSTEQDIERACELNKIYKWENV
jgi:hypothetical protein